MEYFLKIKNNVMEIYLFKWKDILLFGEEKSNYKTSRSTQARCCLGKDVRRKRSRIYTKMLTGYNFYVLFGPQYFLLLLFFLKWTRVLHV